MEEDPYDVNKLQFGPIFGDRTKAEPLTLAAVRDLLQKQHHQLLAQEKEPLFQGAMNYVEKAALELKVDTAKELTAIIREKERATSNRARDLHPFEVAQLVNLAPDDYDVAISLIPSLLDFGDNNGKDLVVGIVDAIRDRLQIQ